MKAQRGIMDSESVFRPRHEPARALYDAFQAEALKRKGRSFEEWSVSECNAVWEAARAHAQQQGKPVPTLAAVQQAERIASGHTDYGAQWAWGVARLLC